jgi:hypothetical protein
LSSLSETSWQDAIQECHGTTLLSAEESGFGARTVHEDKLQAALSAWSFKENTPHESARDRCHAPQVFGQGHARCDLRAEQTQAEHLICHCTGPITPLLGSFPFDAARNMIAVCVGIISLPCKPLYQAFQVQILIDLTT